MVALAAVALLSHHQLHAQETDPLRELGQPLDPSAPLEPLPDLGVDWPDMEQRDEGIAERPETSIADAAAERPYRVRIEGLAAIAAEGLTEQFSQLSKLEANRGDPANAAQIDRRAREDAELLAQLLRAYGYYDGEVTTRVEAPASAAPLEVTLEAVPGQQYRFGEVRLPGIERAGADAEPLRQAFGIEPNEPVNAAAVTNGELALRAELGRRGYAFADVGSLDVAVDHATRTATLVLPVEPNGTRRFGRFIVEGRPLFDAAHLQTIARLDPGDTLSTPMIDDLRRARPAKIVNHRG